jgi:uncharacterized protein (TIGR03435 family)
MPGRIATYRNPGFAGCSQNALKWTTFVATWATMLCQKGRNMTRNLKLVLAMVPVLYVQATTFAQVTSKPVQFEVASVRQAAPADSGSGSPGMKRATGLGAVTITSDRASYRDITFKSLLMRAYDLEPFQISGPAWMDSERYDVVATIPEGTSKEDVPVMLQHLLTERFRMTLHSETKDHPGYILGIGKGGQKLVPAKNPRSAPADPDASPGPASISFTMGGSSTVMKVNGATMPAFADFLSRTLGRPVVDSTKLAGEFDIVLHMSMEVLRPGAQETGTDGSPVESDSSMASLFTAIHDLGLTLDSDKVPLKCFVVDKAEKIPTEN